MLEGLVLKSRLEGGRPVQGWGESQDIGLLGFSLTLLDFNDFHRI